MQHEHKTSECFIMGAFHMAFWPGQLGGLEAALYGRAGAEREDAAAPPQIHP